jgi:hypothetical protein
MRTLVSSRLTPLPLTVECYSSGSMRSVSSSACSIASPASGETRSCAAICPGLLGGSGVWGKTGGLARARAKLSTRSCSREGLRHHGRELLGNGCHAQLLPDDLYVVSGPAGLSDPPRSV